MRYGIFFQLPVHSDQSDQARYRDTIEQCVYAEELGFHSAWFAESHFLPSFSAVPSPLVLLAAVAGRTKTLRLGTASVVLPLHHPLRVAEDAATLDVISNGRVDLGLGRGSWSAQFIGLGVPMSESDRRFSEAMDVLNLAFNESTVRYQGRHHQILGVELIPRPVQKPIPLRVTAGSHSSITWAASRGYPLMTGTVSHPMQGDLEATLETYREAFKPGRYAARPEISVITPMYVAESPAAARSDYEASLRQYMRVIGGDAAWEYACKKMGMLGSVDEVKRQALAVISQPGMAELIGWFNVGGRVSHAKVLKAMERFAKQIRPSLDRASPSNRLPGREEKSVG